MLQDYQAAVLACYQKKKNDGKLSPSLIHPTPANLRDECVKVYSERPLPKDDQTLRLFFPLPSDRNDYSEPIRKIDIDKFRPVITLINRPLTKSDVKNTELLAWLIDFELRPYPVWKSSKKCNIVRLLPVPRSKIKAVIIAFILIALATGGVIMALKNDFTTAQCMYWDGTRYLPVSCYKTIKAEKIALDNYLVKYQQRITRPDTLTKYDIGKVYYLKIGADSIVYFTSPGNFPEDRSRALKKMSKYLFDKYILPKKEMSQDK